MGSRQQTADYLLDQLAGAGRVSAKKMFGEYGLYLGPKLVALICDDRLFVKPTAAGRALAGNVCEEPPYPGAKPHLLVPGDRWEEAEWLGDLFRVTAEALPPPKPKPKPKSKPLRRNATARKKARKR